VTSSYAVIPKKFDAGEAHKRGEQSPDYGARLLKISRLKISRHICRSLLAVLLAPALFCGCHHPTDTEKLVGQWHGTSRIGNVSLPVDWQLRSSGADTIVLTLPQGRLIAEGTWSLRNGILTQHATNRMIEIPGQQKKAQIISPMETLYDYSFAGDKLTLMRPAALETIDLMRNTSP